MELTLYLAKVLGFLYLIAGLAIFTRNKQCKDVAHDFLGHPYLAYFVGMFLTLIGLAVVSAHNVWEGGALPVTVTVLGWAILIKGAIYLLLPAGMLRSWIKWFADKNWYIFGGAVSVLLGLYLLLQVF